MDINTSVAYPHDLSCVLQRDLYINGGVVHIAMFQAPFVPPTVPTRDAFRWAVQQAIAADQAGLTEYWLGEHATQAWECIPNPELVIAAAALETETIRLGPGAHLLPYHNPASLAVQAAFTSQILEGRYMMAVGAGAYPADAAIRGIRDMSKNHEMVMEAIDIMERVWKAEPFHHDGTYWSAGYPEGDPSHAMRDTRPFGGHIDLAVTGLSPNSPSIRFAGQRGYIPLTIYAGDAFVSNHWEVYSEAATAAGLNRDRGVHRVVRDALVADTDAEARKLAIEGAMGRAWGEYLLPVYKSFGMLDGLIKDEDVTPAEVDLEYLADNVWLVGSPETVTRKIQEFQDATGGFGTLIVYSHAYLDDPAPWNESLHRLATEVAPAITQPTDEALALA